MDPVRNPYSPGAGRKPAALVGRDEALDAWDTSLQRAQIGRTDQPVVLYGLRGVGKTVLLSEFRRKAADRGWIFAQIEAGTDKSLRELLGEALYPRLSDLARPSAGRRLLKSLKTALSFKASYDVTGTWTFGVDLSEAAGGGADTGLLDTDLKKLINDLADAAEEEGVGLAILVDEAQDLSVDELATLCATAHAAAQDNWRVLFAFAGLPSLPRILAEAKSYAERFRYMNIEQARRRRGHRGVDDPRQPGGCPMGRRRARRRRRGLRPLPILHPTIRAGNLERRDRARDHKTRSGVRCRTGRERP